MAVQRATWIAEAHWSASLIEPKVTVVLGTNATLVMAACRRGKSAAVSRPVFPDWPWHLPMLKGTPSDSCCYEHEIVGVLPNSPPEDRQGRVDTIFESAACQLQPSKCSDPVALFRARMMAWRCKGLGPADIHDWTGGQKHGQFGDGRCLPIQGYARPPLVQLQHRHPTVILPPADLLGWSGDAPRRASQAARHLQVT